MNIVKKSMISLAVATATVSLASLANAVPEYLTDLQAKYPNAINITCGVCHTTQNGGGGALNPYGLAFDARPHTTAATVNTALNFIEKLDSDGDGYTNLTELTANTLSIKVLPGFAPPLNAAFPAASGFQAVPSRLLFFDNFRNAGGPGVVPNWAMTGGVWRGVAVGGNRVLMSPLPAVETFALVSPPNPVPFLTNFGAGTIEVQAQLVTGDRPDIVFAWTLADNRFVGISANEITIGQDSVVARTRILNAVFADLQPHRLRIVIGPQTPTGSVVTVFVDGTRIGARRFAALATGQVGFRTNSTTARFDNMRVLR